MPPLAKLLSGAWRVGVRRKGKHASETFPRRGDGDGDGEAWARAVEPRIDRGEPIHCDTVATKTFAGLAPNLSYRRHRPMPEDGSIAVSEDDDVTSSRIVREMASRIRELERELGCRTLVAEIFRCLNRATGTCRRRRLPEAADGRMEQQGFPAAAPGPNT